MTSRKINFFGKKIKEIRGIDRNRDANMAY
jgi:hypothetical protein